MERPSTRGDQSTSAEVTKLPASYERCSSARTFSPEPFLMRIIAVLPRPRLSCKKQRRIIGSRSDYTRTSQESRASRRGDEKQRNIPRREERTLTSVTITSTVASTNGLTASGILRPLIRFGILLRPSLSASSLPPLHLLVPGT